MNIDPHNLRIVGGESRVFIDPARREFEAQTCHPERTLSELEGGSKDLRLFFGADLAIRPCRMNSVHPMTLCISLTCFGHHVAVS